MKLKVENTYCIRGILAVLCGGILFFHYLSGLFELVLLFIAYFFFEGVLALAVGIKPTEAGKIRWYLLAGSIINIGAASIIFLTVGLLQMLAPRISAVLLLYLVSSRIIGVGLLELLAGVFRRQAGAAFLRTAIGLVSIIFGVITLFYEDSVSRLVRPFGGYFIALGIALMIVFFTVRAAARGSVSQETELGEKKVM